MDTILILDFGSQTTQLISRRIRESGVYTEIVPGDEPLTPPLLRDVRGIVLSGSPRSVYEEGSPAPDPKVYELGLPILGICYGFHRINHDFGGTVSPLPTREYGKNEIRVLRESPILVGLPEHFSSWMSHGDSISVLAPGFELVAESENHPACIPRPEAADLRSPVHPEVTHCEFGAEFLMNFSSRICGAKRDWNMETSLRKKSSGYATWSIEDVLLLISGGVDSSVVAALLLKALDPARLHLMYIDTGLMRRDETAEVSAALRRLGAVHLHMVNAEDEFLSALRGVTDPEEKRRIIGDLFISVQEREIRAAGIDAAFLAQGTLYTDMIESGKGVGAKAQVIKSHHNVRSPLVEAKRRAGEVIEPLARLYKAEVRLLGRKLGLPDEVVGRLPFPGPGLAVRIPGEVTREKCDILREADAVFISELRRRGLYDSIWQAFCVLLPVRAVGVVGDAREYGYVCALRAIVSHDGMTADVYPFEMKDLLEISGIITNSNRRIGRVVYDISSKPPATIEWE
jgi:GMP synthase (glutamine-hydrolysing)